MAVLNLVPTAQAWGQQPSLGVDYVHDEPVWVAGGSVSDGEDSTYAQLGSYVDGAVHHGESVAADFELSSGIPYALALQVRLATDADVFDNPPSDEVGAFLNVSLTDTDDNQVSAVSQELTDPDVRNGLVASPTWYTWAFPGVPVDQADPTDDGGWLLFGPDDPLATALRGDGLRFVFGAYWTFSSADSPTRRAWVDLMEMRLLVATRGALAPPCHLYPRDDDQGVGTGAIWPPPSSGRPGSYY